MFKDRPDLIKFRSEGMLVGVCDPHFEEIQKFNIIEWSKMDLFTAAALLPDNNNYYLWNF